MQDMLFAENICKTFRLNTGQTLTALDAVSLTVRQGGITVLVGPDGAGKSTLLRIVAGLLTANSGTLLFEKQDLNRKNEHIQADIAYMPQRFGLYEDLTVQENLDLYADLKGLSRQEREGRFRELLTMTAMAPFRQRLAGKLSGGMKQKLGLICTLIAPPKLLLLDEPTVGVDPLSRRELMEIVERLTSDRGMSVLMSTSSLDEAARCDEVVLLFEGKTLAKGTPESIRQQAEGMGYLAMPATGDTPRSLQARLLGASGIIDAVPQGGVVRFLHGLLCKEQQRTLLSLLQGATVRQATASLEDSFMVLLRDHKQTPKKQETSLPASGSHKEIPENTSLGKDTHNETCPAKKTFLEQDACKGTPPEGARLEGARLKEAYGGEKAFPKTSMDPDKIAPIIETQNVSRFFGDFIAVNDISFSVYPGEVFGLLGPNGAGKTTTFRMLCGLLAASKGSLRVASVDVCEAREDARRHLGYVAQKFSLYGPLSVRENLDFFAGAYGLRGQRKKNRIQEMMREFSLERYEKMPAERLPGGYKQRLAMAVGLLHEPAILFLDEPTSGADPLARRDFWKRISLLADKGVTVVVTTHFMEEAEYCDRILIQDSGIMLALGTPKEIRDQAKQRPGFEPTVEDAFIDIVETFRKAEKVA